VPEATVRTDIDQSFYVLGNLFSQVTLDLLSLLDDITDNSDFFLAEVFDLLILIYLRFKENLVCFREA